MSVPVPEKQARFCGQCGAVLPPNDPRFCIECGHRVWSPTSAAPRPVEEPRGRAAVGPTVRLPNARGEQSVVGGTVKLPTSGAVPPGLWLLPNVPGPSDVVAIYAPLHAVVGGWSATTSDGWRKLGQAWAADGTSRELVRFEVEREWFAALGCAEDMRLRVRIGASSFADEGRTRRGFRYRIGADPPMEVIDAYWTDARPRQRRDLPVPEIQIMAPPRVRRVSDYGETILRLNAREAESWSKASAVHGVFRMPEPAQQRTPAGRGIPLFEVPGGTALTALTGMLYRLHRVQMRHPLIVGAGAWVGLRQRIQAEARGLGLDMETDAVIEWWLDRQGHDGAVFERGAHAFAQGRTVVAFRRSQIAEIVG